MQIDCLLDTDVMIDYLRQYSKTIDWIQNQGIIGLPGFVGLELLQGCRNEKEQTLISKQLGKFDIIWPDSSDCEWAYKIYLRYHLINGIEIMDALIASIVKKIQKPFYTFNIKHFETIPDIEVIMPYSKR